ncbi:hypothetical protein HK100_003184 [Physocladia obscura]|uniref:Glycoside hydrolase family 2 catalytic domain-containing protein n=1 Tax=Physocladia obscura TaxID=109957 RepID=A0AAD5XL91_9FUNG|nr:hypothetical protein HK100_003184 [Physocladia obscura]
MIGFLFLLVFWVVGTDAQEGRARGLAKQYFSLSQTNDHLFSHFGDSALPSPLPPPTSRWLFSFNATDETSWRPVSVPHSWNIRDGLSPNYRRAKATYRTILPTLGVSADISPLMNKGHDDEIELSNNDPDKNSVTIVLDVGAANAHAEVFANTILVGSHSGGFSRFRVEIPSAVITNPATVVDVTVDNSASLTDIVPLSGDFTFFGGIYRDIGYWTVRRGVPIFDMFDVGSFGVYFIQKNTLSRERPSQGIFDASIRVSCFGNLTDTRELILVLRIFEGTTSKSVVDISRNVSLPFSTCLVPTTFTIPFIISSPRLWHGRSDPFLYRPVVEIVYQESIVDSFTTRIGVRSYHVDPVYGFFLNGQPYSLHGVNLHQDWESLGWAISEVNTRRNFAMFDDLNITALRCAHYQHSELTYKLADEYGFVVWAEIPNIENAPISPGLYLNTASQLRELIRQAYNHASILFWSVGNELKIGNGNSPAPLVWMLNKVAKAEDPYRLTTIAVNTPLTHPMMTFVDTAAINIYPGWYGGKASELGISLDKYHITRPDLSFGITEYGAGASIYIHSEKPVIMDHSEEYQAKLHQESWPQLAARKYLWWKTVWNFADFASSWRHEGDRDGMNDKGLVTYDRTVKKDAFYYYKSVWNSEALVHVIGSRFTYRDPVVDVTVYANGVETVKLFVNGVLVGEMVLRTDRVHIFPRVQLSNGRNVVVGTGGKTESRVVWYV